jgi:beta-mannanase
MKRMTRFAGLAVASQSAKFSATTYQEFTNSSNGLLEFYNSFPGVFDVGGALHAVQLHALPLIQLNPGKRDSKVIRNISTGYYDKKIAAYADAVRNFKYCVVLSLGHEMNGWWYHWGAGWTTAAIFKKAWWRVHNIFKAQGATNVIWSFDPSHQYQQVAAGKVGSPAEKWYPGNKYVDWIGLDGYLQTDANKHPQNFNEIFGFQLKNIKQFAPDKPIYLAETGVAPGPDAIAQIANLFAGMTSNHLSGLVWFDALAKHDYRLGINKPEDAVYKNNLAGFLRNA